MKITLMGNDGVLVEIELSDAQVNTFNYKYPKEVGLFLAEEMGELQQAVSKQIRKGTAIDGVAEEIVDVEIMLSHIIKLFKIPAKTLEKYAKAKTARHNERIEADTYYYKSEAQRDKYCSKSTTLTTDFDIANSMVITRNANHEYAITGDTQSLGEFTHVLVTLYNKTMGYPEDTPFGINPKLRVAKKSDKKKDTAVKLKKKLEAKKNKTIAKKKKEKKTK